MENQAAGISIIAFIVAVGVSMGYYQFVYLPQLMQSQFRPEVLNPPQTIKISISPGSSQPSQIKNFVPKKEMELWVLPIKLFGPTKTRYHTQ